MNSITYRGPSLTELHEDYAKNGRIDDRAPIRARRAITIEAPVDVVWETLTGFSRWSESLEPDLKHVAAEEGVVPDAVFTRTIQRANIVARFAVVDENRELAWTGSSFGANVVHRFRLEPSDEGRTRVVVEQSMAGRLLGTFFDVQKLAASLETSLRHLKRAAEARSVEGDATQPARGLANDAA